MQRPGPVEVDDCGRGVGGPVKVVLAPTLVSVKTKLGLIMASWSGKYLGREMSLGLTIHLRIHQPVSQI